MTKDEALRLALEALEICEQDGYIPVRLTRDAITAIKAALEAKDEPVSTGETLFRQFMSEAEKAGVTHLIPPQQEAKDEPVALAWAEGYRMGIADERTSEANIGIAGFNAKVEPARENPYITTPSQQEAKDEPVQVSPLQFVEMVIDKEDCIGKPIIWAEWPNKENT